jgi:L-arabinokinase
MDQVTATLGRRDHLLLLRCQPAEVIGHQRLPREARVVGIDSAVAHRVAGAQYGRVRVATFMGRAIIAAAGEGDPPGGYLCNLPMDRFLQRYHHLLPETLSGEDFLARYGVTGDDATQVEPRVLYRVRECASHPLREQAHIRQFLQALDHYGETGEPSALEAAGEAMHRSHRSYSTRCMLGSPETDLLVELVREYGPRYGLHGAKITGGGSGGTVAVLGAGPAVEEGAAAVADLYRRRTGNPARVIAGSSDGAMASPASLGMVDEGGTFHAR